jgi:hypothetical protein
MNLDLTREEQVRVRAALRFLRTRFGGWIPLAETLRFQPRTLTNIVKGRTVTPLLAFRLSRFVNVSLDDLLAGRFPAVGACPYCGHAPASLTDDGVPK